MEIKNLSSEIQTTSSFSDLTDLTEGWIPNDTTTSGDVVNTYPWYPYYPDYHTIYIDRWWERKLNKTEEAFKLTKALLKLKLVKLNTAKQFIDLMEEIIKIL